MDQAFGQESPAAWIKNAMREGLRGETATTSAQPLSLNEKQRLAVCSVRRHADQLGAYRAAVDQGLELPALPEPLRMVLAGTAGTGKTGTIYEMVRQMGAHRFELMAPTGCAARGIGGQVSLFA